MIRGTYNSKFNEIYENVQNSIHHLQTELMANIENIVDSSQDITKDVNTKKIFIASFIFVVLISLILITIINRINIKNIITNTIKNNITNITNKYNEFIKKQKLKLPSQYQKKAKESPFINPSTTMIVPSSYTLNTKQTLYRKRIIDKTHIEKYEPLDLDIHTEITIFGNLKKMNDNIVEYPVSKEKIDNDIV
jgi:hypothetical protein